MRTAYIFVSLFDKVLNVYDIKGRMYSFFSIAISIL